MYLHWNNAVWFCRCTTIQLPLQHRFKKGFISLSWITHRATLLLHIPSLEPETPGERWEPSIRPGCVSRQRGRRAGGHRANEAIPGCTAVMINTSTSSSRPARTQWIRTKVSVPRDHSSQPAARSSDLDKRFCFKHSSARPLKEMNSETKTRQIQTCKRNWIVGSNGLCEPP